MNNSKQKVDTPYRNSWADQMARRHIPTQRDPEVDRLMRAGVVHPQIANAVTIAVISKR